MKRFLDSRKRNNSLYYFWRGYLLFGVLLLVCILPMFVKAFLLLEDNVQSSTYKNVEKGMEILDSEISTLSNATLDIQSHKYFPYIRTLGETRRASDYYILLDFRRKFVDATKYLSFANNTFLYFPNDLIIFPDNVYAIEAQDVSKRLSTERYRNLESWFDELNTEKHIHEFVAADVYDDNIHGEFSGIPYVHTYARSNQSDNPMLVAIFPVQSLIELWRLQELQDIAHISISNGKHGDVLFSNGNDVSNWSTEIVVQSKNSNLSVEVIIPNSYFIGQLSGVIALAALYFLIFLLAAIIFSVRLAYKNTQKYSQLEDEVSHWMLREQVLTGLEGKQLEDFLALHRTFPAPFRLAVIQLTQTEWSIPAAEVKAALSEHHIEHFFVSKVKPNLFVMLFMSNADINQMKQDFRRFMGAGNHNWRCDCLISVGPSHMLLEGLKDLYKAVLCNMKCFAEKKLIFHEDIDGYIQENLTDVNILENLQLTDMILSGNEKAATALIRSQWKKVKTARVDSVFKQMFYIQYTVLSTVAKRLDYSLSDTDLSFEDSISEIEFKMVHVAEQLCELVRNRKKAEKNDLPKKIIDYMKLHYTDPDFYMTSLVDEFGLSDKTIAKLIKGYQDQTFSEFLEELRLQKALSLLDNPANSINYVASASGFRSENTFFKVFKRRFSISPSNYRENKQIGIQDQNDRTDKCEG